MKNFGTWLQEARRERRVTQEELARNIGYTSAYVSTVERQVVTSKKGTAVRPDIEFVEKAARFLGKPLDEARLAAGYAPQTETPPPDDIEREQIERLFIRRRALTKKNKEWFDRLLAMLNRELDQIEREESEKGTQ